MDPYEHITAMTSFPSFGSSSSSSPLPQSSSLGHLPSHEDESPPPPPSPPALVVRPCGACKGLRRRCGETCILAPYFPPTQPLKFLAVHRVFEASNVCKFLQGLPESQRADAVDSMVYEATIRIRDPVYGCAGVISSLQKLVNEVQMELAATKAQLLNITSLLDNLPVTNNACTEMIEADQLPTYPLEDFMFYGATTHYPFQNHGNF